MQILRKTPENKARLLHGRNPRNLRLSLAFGRIRRFGPARHQYVGRLQISRSILHFHSKMRLAQNTATPAGDYRARCENHLKQTQSGIEPFASYLKAGNMASQPVSHFICRPPSGASASARDEAAGMEWRSRIRACVIGNLIYGSVSDLHEWSKGT
jgi:hypothetical protein